MESFTSENSRCYNQHFNPMSDLSFLNHELTASPSGGYYGNAVTFLHELMKSGEFRGTDLLEVGCGPSVLFSIIPSQYYHNVYLADYLERNVDLINTWVQDKPGQVDFQLLFDVAGRQLGKGSTWPGGPTELRQKICGVWQCDILLQDVLPPGVKTSNFDCITSSFVLQSACSSDDQLNKAVLNLASLLNTGGFLITYGTLESNYFILDGIKFTDLPITDSSMCSAVRNAGLKLVYKRCEDLEDDKSVTNAKTVALYVAKKD